MSARDYLRSAITSGIDGPHAESLLDTFAAEVVAERDAQIIAWLGKKAREYKGNRAEAASDALARMASKIARGAVRPTPTGRQATKPQPEPRPNTDTDLAQVCFWWSCHLTEPHPAHMGCLGIEQPAAPQPRRMDEDGRCRHCRRTPGQCDATGCGGRHAPYSAPWSAPREGENRCSCGLTGPLLGSLGGMHAHAPAPQQETAPDAPAVGDRYDCRHGGEGVTVTRLWALDNGHRAVDFEYRDGESSALPLDSFRRAYRPEAESTVIEEFEAQHPDAMRTAREGMHAPARPRTRRKNADTPGAES